MPSFFKTLTHSISFCYNYERGDIGYTDASPLFQKRGFKNVVSYFSGLRRATLPTPLLTKNELMTLQETGYNSIVCITPCPIIKMVFETVDKYLQDNRDREVYTILPDLQRLIFEQSDILLDSPYKEQSKACAKVLFKLAVRIQKRLQATK